MSCKYSDLAEIDGKMAAITMENRARSANDDPITPLLEEALLLVNEASQDIKTSSEDAATLAEIVRLADDVTGMAHYIRTHDLRTLGQLLNARKAGYRAVELSYAVGPQ